MKLIPISLLALMFSLNTLPAALAQPDISISLTSSSAAELTEGSSGVSWYNVTLSEPVTSDVDYSFTISTNGQCLATVEGKGGMDSPKNPMSSTGIITTHYPTTMRYFGLVAADDTKYEGRHSCNFTYRAVSTDPDMVFDIQKNLSIALNDNDAAPAPAPAPVAPKPSQKPAAPAPSAPTPAPAPVQAPVSVEQVKLNSSLYSATAKKMEFHEGSGITFSGKTVPNAIVTLYVYSEPKKYVVTADKEGNWSYTVTGLEPGEHRAEVEATDPVTKKTSERKEIAKFIVKSAVVNSPYESKDVAKQSDRSVLLSAITLITLLTIAVGLALFKRYRNR